MLPCTKVLGLDLIGFGNFSFSKAIIPRFLDTQPASQSFPPILTFKAQTISFATSAVIQYMGSTFSTNHSTSQSCSASARSIVGVARAVMLRTNPTSQPVGDIRRITMRGNPTLEPGAAVDAARVVETGALVEDVLAVAGRARVPGVVHALGQAVAGVGSGGALADHGGDDVVGARVLDPAVVVAGAGAVVALHDARVADAVVGRRGAHAAAALLEDDGEDEAVVDAGLVGDLLDCVPDLALQ